MVFQIAYHDFTKNGIKENKNLDVVFGKMDYSNQ